VGQKITQNDGEVPWGGVRQRDTVKKHKKGAPCYIACTRGVAGATSRE
jgi:hypothetical protein